MNKAVIFDMDGTIINSIGYHYEVWMELLAERGIKFSLNEFYTLAGKSTDFFIDSLHKKGLQGKKKDLIKEKDARYLAKVNIKVPPLIAGFPSLLEKLKEANLKLAIATSEPRIVLDAIIKGHPILKKFDEIVTGDEVMGRKPDPIIFFYAADKLKVSFQNCVVFEDSLTGVRAAKAADMYCIAIKGTYLKNKLENAGADKVITNFKKITVEEILNALN